MSTEAEITTAIALVETDAPIDAVAEAQGKVENFLRLAKEFDAQLKARMIAWIKANGPLTVGTMQTKVVKQEKQEKPKEPSYEAIADAMFDAAKGDLKLFASTIASDGIKPGAAKRLLGKKRFDELFNTTWKDVMKDGAPGEKLLTSNLDFVNQG